MKWYKCLLCEFETGDRKRIRRHAREVHKIKGKRKEEGSDISRSYESVWI
ncbi:MAG: hypothetical protein ACTSVW_00445 [Candidatus Njordarchaeales archaeon]